MPAIPLASGSFDRAPSFQPAVILRNMIVEQDFSGCSEDQLIRIQRPGCANYKTVASGTLVRGLIHAQGLFGSLPVAAIGTTLYKFDNTTATSIGTIANDGGFVEMVANDLGIGVLSANVLYFHNGTTLTTITIPDIGGVTQVPVSITMHNGYIIVAMSSGHWMWVVPGETTIDPLHFATAESMPDNLVCARTLNDETWLFGTESTEVWQESGGTADLILIPADSRKWDKGVMAKETVQPFDNTLVLLGNDGIVYRITNGAPERISNTGIEEKIRLRTGVPSALSFVFDGHAMYCLYVPGVSTFVFDVLTEKWAEFTTSGTTAGWRPRTACSVGTVVLLGDSTSGKVFKLDPTISTDDGTVFERAISGALPFHNGRQRNDSISVHVGSSADVNVRIRYHDGGVSAWSAYRTKLAKAPAAVVIYWRLGAAKTPSRVVEISTTDNVLFRVSSAWANDARSN